MKPAGIFGNNISKCPDKIRKRTPISLHRVPPVWSNKVKDYVTSVGSSCITAITDPIWTIKDMFLGTIKIRRMGFDTIEIS